MIRGIQDRNILDTFCIEFCAVVETHCPYIIVSGFLAISTGRTRSTEDIDMIISKITERQFVALHTDLVSHGFECMQGEDPHAMFTDYLNECTSIRYTRKNNPLPEMEVKLAKDQLDDFQLQTRQKIPLTGLPVWFSSVSMNIAFKEEYLKSDKDMEDARHLRVVFHEQISESEITEIKKMIKKYRMN